MSGFIKGPEPVNRLALQDACFLPDLSLSVSVACLSLGVLETEPCLGQGEWVWGQVQDLAAHSPFLLGASKQTVISSWTCVSRGGMVWRGRGDLPHGGGFERRRLGPPWLLVAGAGTGAEGQPGTAGLWNSLDGMVCYVLMNNVLVLFLGICERGLLQWLVTAVRNPNGDGSSHALGIYTLPSGTSSLCMRYPRSCKQQPQRTGSWVTKAHGGEVAGPDTSSDSCVLPRVACAMAEPG